jgi:hypothetical protein
MSRIIYPINNKLYTAEDVEIINSPRTSGVYSVLDFDLSLSGNVLTVGKGLGWIKNADFKGKAVAFTEPETITLDSADSTLDRYDVVAVRYDATKKEPELVVIKGTASENPVMPKRNTESYLYELFLYSILRKAGESTASFENVTDLRENKNYCGIMEDSVTSAVAPVYETLFEYKSGENSVLKVGDTIDFDYSKYQFFIATIDGAFSENDIILTPTEDKTGQGKFNCLIGSNVISVLTGSSQTTFYLRAQIKIDELSVTTGHTIQIVQTSNTADFNLENIDNSSITKLVGVTKQPKGYVAVDDVYNPESHNAQSGEAVKQAIDEALENFDFDILENFETTDNKATTIDENSTDTQYPSAKAVYDFVNENQVNVDGDINNIKNSIGNTTYIKDITDTFTLSNGYYSKSTGAFTANATAQGTEIFPVIVGEKYYVTGAYGFFASLIVAFDENNTYLPDKSVFSSENANTNVDDYEYIIPEGVAYIGCSTRLAGTSAASKNLIVKKEFTELNNVQELVRETAQEVADTVSLNATNVCPNGNFEDTSNWNARNTGTNLSISNNIATVTNIPDTSAGQIGITQSLDKDALPQIANSVWFISAKIKVPKETQRIQMTLNNVDGYETLYVNTDVKISDDYITICGVKRFTQSTLSGATLGITADFNRYYYPDFSCEIKEVTIIKDIDNTFTDEQIKNIYSAILEQHGGYIDGSVNVAGVKGTLNKLNYDYANDGIVTKNKVVTVGENGDFKTINQALRYLSKFYPAYLDGGIECEVKILDGTVINEQIRLERIDLSHISITTDNADNTVQVDVTGWGGITHDTRGNKPFFSAEYGARLPCIKCLFSCIVPEGGWIPSKYTDESGNEVETNIAVGYFCNRGSTGVIAGETTYSGSTSQGLANVGFENFYDNIIANNNSEIVLREAIARNAGRYGVMARHISRVSARSADITNCADTAAYADRSSMMDIRFADVSGSNNGLQCFNTSNMTAVETIANNITNIVADSREGSVLNCAEMTIDTAKDVFKVLNGGTVIATSTSPTNVSGTLNSKERNTVDINGIIYG